MNEKKEKMQITLGTAISIIIILILLVIGGFFYYQNYITNEKLQTTQSDLETSKETINKIQNIVSENKNNSNETETSSFKMVSLETATPKVVENKNDVYTISECGNNLYSISLKKGKVYVTAIASASEFVAQGLASSESQVKLKNGSKNEITGFTKKVVDIQEGGGQVLTGSFIAFLMEDGTVEYTTINNMVTNLTVQGKVNGLANILKIKSVSVSDTDGDGSTSIVAIDNENNFYDICYMINKQK